MKTKLYLTFLLSWLVTASFCQSFEKPYVESVGDRLCYINKVELTKDFTIISFEHLNNNNGWIRLNPGIKIKSGSKEFAFLKAEGIPLDPDSYQFADGVEKHAFKVYFQRIPKEIKLFDVIEAEPGTRYDFNFYGVDLKKKRLSDVQTSHFLKDSIVSTEMVLSPPSSTDGKLDGFNFGNMLKDIYSSAIDSYITYLKTPGKLVEIAKLNKEYYDALISAGFSKEQAMQILVSTPLIPNSTSK